MSVFMRIKPVGTGVESDKWRVPLPSYRMVADLGAPGWIVEVRDEDVPPNSPVPQAINVPGVGIVNVITGLSAPQLAQWQAALDQRYPQRDKSVPPTVQ